MIITLVLQRTSLQKIIDTAIRFTLYDFVDRTFNYGSLNVAQNITNSTSGPQFIGDILGWYLDYTTNTTTEINYSLAGLGANYTISKEYIVGLD